MLAGLNSQALARPVKVADSPVVEITMRGNNLGELVVQPGDPDGRGQLLLESALMAGTLNGYTPGAGAVGPMATAFSDTSALLMVKNNASPGASAVNLRIDTLKLIVQAIGTGVTNMRLVAVLDDASRWVAPGGSALAFAPSSNTGAVQASSAQGAFGNLTAGPATGNKRIIGQCVLKTAAPAALDEYTIQFGGSPQSTGLAATTASAMARFMESLLIAPGKMLLLHLFCGAGTVAPTFEPQLTLIER